MWAAEKVSNDRHFFFGHKSEERIQKRSGCQEVCRLEAANSQLYPIKYVWIAVTLNKSGLLSHTHTPPPPSLLVQQCAIGSVRFVLSARRVEANLFQFYSQIVCVCFFFLLSPLHSIDWREASRDSISCDMHCEQKHFFFLKRTVCWCWCCHCHCCRSINTIWYRYIVTV